VTRFFLFKIFDVAKLVIKPQGHLAKFGYRPDKKKFLKIKE
jgi:hypothetical protein